MTNNKNIILKTIIFILLFIIKPDLFATNQDNNMVKALQLFDAEKYSEAEIIFGQLLEEDPDNTMYNYYYGACRTENGHFSENDLKYLLNAGKKVTPHRINYYLGMQYHALNNWEQALKFYNQFRLSVPEDEQKGLELAMKIQQCYDQVNPFKSAAQNDISAELYEEQEKTDVSPADKSTAEDAETKIISTEDTATTPVITEDDDVTVTAGKPLSIGPGDFKITRKALPDLPGVKPTVSLPPGEHIKFQINSKITYLHTSHFQTEEGKKIYNELNLLKKELDTKLNQADQLREEYLRSSDADEKEEIGAKILTLENESYNLKEKITRLSSICRNVESEYWQKASNTEVDNFILELEKIRAAGKRQRKELPVTTETTNTPLIIGPDELFGITEVRQRGSQSSQVSGLVYKIQIGAFSRGVPAYMKRLYDKLSMIRKIENYTDEDGVVVYTTGKLSNLEDAMKMQDQIRQEGIKDAHIVPYFNGKRITLEQSKKIESGNDKKRN